MGITKLVMKCRWERRDWPSKPVAIAVSTLSFAVFIWFVPQLLAVLLMSILGTNYLDKLWVSDTVALGVVLALSMIVAYVLARIVYGLLRWRYCPHGVLGVCGNCGYSLEGNVSHICPECGTPVRCKNCHYILVGNVSGRCPECGTPCDEEPLKKNV